MKRLVAISLAGAMFAAAGLAQSSNAWLEQWFKTKTGHYSPMEEARLRAEQANKSRQQRADSGKLPGSL